PRATAIGVPPLWLGLGSPCPVYPARAKPRIHARGNQGPARSMGRLRTIVHSGREARECHPWTHRSKDRRSEADERSIEQVCLSVPNASGAGTLSFVAGTWRDG